MMIKERSASPQRKVFSPSRNQQQQDTSSQDNFVVDAGRGGGGGRNEMDFLLPKTRTIGIAREGPTAAGRRRGPRGSMMILFSLGLCTLLFLLGIKGHRSKHLWTDLNQQGANLVSLVSRIGGGVWHRKREEEGGDNLYAEEGEELLLLSPSSSSSSSVLLYSLARNLDAKLAIGIISGSRAEQYHRIKIAGQTWVTSLNPKEDGMLIFSDVTNVTIPTIGLSGTDDSWKGAQARWLPALAHLYLSFPSADWFILGDDDTFLSPHNLKDMLMKYDATKSWYLGRAMFVEPQEGPLAEGKKGSLVAFAHGGSAMALSSGLMQAFDPYLEEALDTGICTGASGYGDGDLGLCLDHYLGITVTHEACLHSSGPESFLRQNMSDGFFAQVDKPCSFHYAFRSSEEESMGIPGGDADYAAGKEEEKEKKKDDDGEQMWKWHRKYNLGEKEDGDQEEEEEKEPVEERRRRKRKRRGRQKA